MLKNLSLKPCCAKVTNQETINTIFLSTYQKIAVIITQKKLLKINKIEELVKK